MNNRYYVYIIKYDGVEIYVGKGSGDRCYQHRYAKTPIGDFIREKLKLGIHLDIVKSGLMCESAAFVYESFLIGMHKLTSKGGTLLNQCSGMKIRDPSLRVKPEVYVDKQPCDIMENKILTFKEKKPRKSRSDVGKKRVSKKIPMTVAERAAKYRAKKKDDTTGDLK